MMLLLKENKCGKGRSQKRLSISATRNTASGGALLVSEESTLG